jgi:hypothetical protein
MVYKKLNEKGFLAKILEQGIKVLLIKECKKINNIKIDIISSSTQIIKGEIEKVNITAEDINYKNLFFDKFSLEANHLKINFKLITKELYFKNDPIIKFKISLSESSLKTILLSSDWNCIGNTISKEISSQDKLEDVKIINDQLLIINYVNKGNKTINQREKIEIRTAKGKIYFYNLINNKIIQIPMEEKIYIENVYIENNLLNIFGNSSIGF